MLPAQRRVRRRADFTTAVRHGRRAAAPGLVLHVADSPASQPARAGFIVGRAVGPAVARNRLRRRLRHLVAPLLDQLPAGTLVVVRARPPAAQQTGPELAKALDALLDRILVSDRVQQ